MSVIEVNNVTKEYRLGQLRSLKQNIFAILGRLNGKKTVKREPFKALEDVSFKVEEGEVLGIIGKNGAGKSTLLKLLARISVPTKGNLKVNGSVAPLIEVGAGLNPELTGRENIFLNATILGISRSEIKKKLDDIVSFAELEDFIDTPVKRYSSGMSVRLGFSIATVVDADILIVDEVLAVGDLAFQRKCYDRIEKMIKRQGKTVLIVGHNIRQMERICSRMILMDKGQVLMDGNPTLVSNAYYYDVSGKNEKKLNSPSNEKISGTADTGEIEIMDISLYNGDAADPTDILNMHRTIRIGVRFEAKIDLPSPEIIIGIHTPDFIYIDIISSKLQTQYMNFSQGVYNFECQLPDMIIKPGSYALRLAFLDKYNRLMWYGQNLRAFRVRADESELVKEIKTEGLVELPWKWCFPDREERRDMCQDYNKT
jgi:ABC-type polysaccharide/polyol phosphate transport system ATPase subunit